ncbi:MAG: hypothetical protein AB7L66_06345 [Gemmatimonadales bacterium]
MIRPVSGTRPVDVLRQSSDQIRRAAELLAEITDETAAAPDDRFASQGRSRSPETTAADVARDATILQAQRSFVAGLRLRQQHGDHFPD